MKAYAEEIKSTSLELSVDLLNWVNREHYRESELAVNKKYSNGVKEINNKMKVYIGTKIVQAEPMTDRYFSDKFKGIEKLDAAKPGYKVIYPDGFVSWSPKEVFEVTYHEIPYLLNKKGGE